MPRIKADIVTISHDQPGHNAISAVTGDPKVLSGPGDFEVGGVIVTGLTTFHKASNGEAQERNIAYFFDFNGFTIGHLGDLGQVPQQRQMEELGDVDVLLVPVSGQNTLDASRMTEVISLLEPRIVIPMHYLQPGLSKTVGESLEPVDKFLKEFGVGEPETAGTLKITKGTLPEQTQVILLEPSAS